MQNFTVINYCVTTCSITQHTICDEIFHCHITTTYLVWCQMTTAYLLLCHMTTAYLLQSHDHSLPNPVRWPQTTCSADRWQLSSTACMLLCQMTTEQHSLPAPLLDDHWASQPTCSAVRWQPSSTAYLLCCQMTTEQNSLHCGISASGAPQPCTQHGPHELSWATVTVTFRISAG